MAGSTWTNPDQVVFLTKRLIDFVEAQNAKTLTAFWTITWRDFFILWPTPESELVPNGLNADWNGSPKKSKKKKKAPEVAAAAIVVPPIETKAPEVAPAIVIPPIETKASEVAPAIVIPPIETKASEVAAAVVVPPIESKWLILRRESIKNWYNNHGFNKGKRRMGKNNNITLALQSSAPRVLSEHNMYSKLHYNERVKPAVEAEIGDRKISRGERFAITNKLLAEIYDKEPESLKEEIRKIIEKDREAKEAERQLNMAVIAADEVLGPKEYLTAQCSLPDMIGDFLEAMAKRTGWSFTVVGGGPDGAKEGKIRTISLHTGKDTYGQTFPKAIPDYVDRVLVPYSKFLESVYLQSVRNSFIPKAEETADKAGASSPDKVPIPNTSPADTLSPNKPKGLDDTTTTISMDPSSADKVPTSNASMRTSELVLTIPPEMTSCPSTGMTGTTTTVSMDLLSPDKVPTSNATMRTSELAPDTLTLPSTTAGEQRASADLFTFPLPTLTIPPEMTSSSTGMTDAFTFDFSIPFQEAGTDENGAHHYGNTFADGHNLSFTSLMGMPLHGDGGGDTGGGFTGWDASQSGQSAYNTGENWGLRNTFNGSWGNTFNGEMNMVINDSVPAMAVEPNTNESAVEIANTVEVGRVPEVSSVSEIAVDMGVDVATSSEVSNGAEAPVTNAPDIQEKRTRKPAARGEIIPLTTKDAPVALPEWFSLARTHLEDGLDVKDWKDCVETWINLENPLGLSEVGSQRMNTKLRPVILSKWLVNRKFHSLPDVDDVGAYAKEWLSWWNSVQPKWRQSVTGSLPLPLSTANEKDDLICLKKYGPSGLVTIMIGLKWWASIRNEDGKWLAAVKDVKSCMDELMASGRKRKGDDSEKGARKKRK